MDYKESQEDRRSEIQFIANHSDTDIYFHFNKQSLHTKPLEYPNRSLKMYKLIALAAALFSASLTSAQTDGNTVVINAFSAPGCQVLVGANSGLISSTELNDGSCQQISSTPGELTSFDFSQFALADGCNIIFSQQADCSVIDNVIVPNDSQCFGATGTLPNDLFAGVFCN